MSEETVPPPQHAGFAYVVGIFGSFLIILILIWGMRKYSPPQVDNQQRKAERAKALMELRGAESEALNNVAWIDQSKGLVRLRIDDAMRLAEQMWRQNPDAARSNLIARVEKATYVPPPPPAKPSPFE